MSRVALLLAGFIRKAELESLGEFVITPNVARGNEVSAFVSVWDTYGNISHAPTGNSIFSGVGYWTGQTRTYDNTPVDKQEFERKN